MPIFGNRISPRLEFATNLKLLEAEKHKVLNSEIKDYFGSLKRS